MKSKSVHLPVPDIANYPGKILGWGIWSEYDRQQGAGFGKPEEADLGLLIFEAGLLSHKIIGWAVFFSIIAVAGYAAGRSPFYLLCYIRNYKRMAHDPDICARNQN